MSKEKEWTTEISWDEFRDTGLLFHINQILHPFGMAIAVNIDNEKGNVIDAKPMRVNYRGFNEYIQTSQHIKIADYLAKNAHNFPEDIK